jgi:hypothetical protein
VWHLDGQLASADFGDIRLAVAISEGDRKVLVQTSDSTLLANLWDMPAVSSQPLMDAYVRDHDLVCLLEPSEAFPFHTQLYWTLRHVRCAPAPLMAISLLVSIRTDLLDTHPAIEVVSRVAGSGLIELHVAGGPAYQAPLREDVTLVDFATPEDCAKQATRQAAEHGLLTVDRTLFNHFLEKGVIRSGRLFAAAMPGEVDQSTATALCHELLATELPLTT